MNDAAGGLQAARPHRAGALRQAATCSCSTSRPTTSTSTRSAGSSTSSSTSSTARSSSSPRPPLLERRRHAHRRRRLPDDHDLHRRLRRLRRAEVREQAARRAQNAAAKKKIGELQDFVAALRRARVEVEPGAVAREADREAQGARSGTRRPKRSSLVRPFIRFEFEKPSGRDVLRVGGRLKKAFQLAQGRTSAVFDGTSPQREPRRQDRRHRPERHRQVDAAQAPRRRGSHSSTRTRRRTTLAPDAGEIRWGHDVSVGYFAQDHHESLGESAGAMSAFEWLYQFDKNAPQETIRGIMGRLLFSRRGGAQARRSALRRRARAACCSASCSSRSTTCSSSTSRPTTSTSSRSRACSTASRLFNGHRHRHEPRPPLRERGRDARPRAPPKPAATTPRSPTSAARTRSSSSATGSDFTRK